MLARFQSPAGTDIYLDPEDVSCLLTPQAGPGQPAVVGSAGVVLKSMPGVVQPLAGSPRGVAERVNHCIDIVKNGTRGQQETLLNPPKAIA